ASVDPGNLVLKPGASGKATLQLINVTTATQMVSWTATADSGIAVNPPRGSLLLAPGSRISTQVTVSASAAEGPHHVTFDITMAGGKHRTLALNVPVAKLGDLWPYYTNAGITDDTNTNAATYDGGGWSYSAQALKAQGVTPGGTVTVHGIGYTWPNAPVATTDNIEASGQTIALAAPAHVNTIGLLGSATNAGRAGAAGTVTVRYTDGTTSQFTAALSDWTLGGGAFAPVPGNTTGVAMPYRNAGGNQRDNVKTYLFATEGHVSVAKTVASVTLPQ